METKTRNKVYPLAMTAVMAAVHLRPGPPFHSRGAGAHLLYEFCHLHHAVCSGLETGYRQLSGLCAHRHGGNACVLRVLRRPGQAGRPTGGYIVGFIPMAVIAGLVIDKFRNRGVQLAGMIGATALCYAFGTAWFCFQAESDLLPALTMCVFPFIPGDLVKMVVAIAVGPMLRNRLKKAGLQPEG